MRLARLRGAGGRARGTGAGPFTYHERDDTDYNDAGHDNGSWLREQLDRELAGLAPRPHALHEVLIGARSKRPGQRRSGVLVGSAAAAAVLVVALAVPVLRGTVFSDREPAGQTAAAVSPPLPFPPQPVLPSGTPTSRATPIPARTSPVVAVPPTRRPSPTHAPLPTNSTTPSPTKCPPADPAEQTAVRIDLDGDGRPDAVRLAAGSLTVGLTGSGSASTRFTTSSPYVQVLPVEADGKPGSELLLLTQGAASDGSVITQGVLYAVRGCTPSHPF